MSFDQNQYKKEFEKEKYAILKVRIPRSKKEILDGLTETTGKSINRIFVESVEKTHHVDLTIVESELKQSK